MYYLKAREIQKVISVLNAYSYTFNAELKTVLYMMFYTGTVPSELVKLRHCDIDIANQTVQYTRRRVWLQSRVIAEILKYKQPNESEDLYFTVTIAQMESIIRSIAEYYNPEFRLRSILDGFVMLLINKHLDIRLVRYMTGRSYEDLIKIYEQNPFDKTTVSKRAKHKFLR